MTMTRSHRTVSITRGNTEYTMIQGGSYGCSDERSIYCLGGPFSELFTADPVDYMHDGQAMCAPCAASLGWPVMELKRKMKESNQ